MKKRMFGFISILLLFIGCGQNPLKNFQDEVSKYGYIPYATPMQYAGIGTLVGGSPSQMYPLTAATTCFPKEVQGMPTNMHLRDNSSLPQTSYTFKIDASSVVDGIRIFELGNPILGVGAKFEVVQSMQMSMSGVHIEFFDTIRLSNFYKNSMSNICKDYLDKFGFIIQAIKVDELVFKFYNIHGAAININIDFMLEDLVSIDTGVSYTVKNGTELHITTPKYIGYRLGKLQRVDEGLALYRASTTSQDSYIFESIALFNSDSDIEDDTIWFNKQPEPSLDDFVNYKEEDIILNHSNL